MLHYIIYKQEISVIKRNVIHFLHFCLFAFFLYIEPDNLFRQSFELSGKETWKI